MNSLSFLQWHFINTTFYWNNCRLICSCQANIDIFYVCQHLTNSSSVNIFKSDNITTRVLTLIQYNDSLIFLQITFSCVCVHMHVWFYAISSHLSLCINQRDQDAEQFHHLKDPLDFVSMTVYTSPATSQLLTIINLSSISKIHSFQKWYITESYISI